MKDRLRAKLQPYSQQHLLRFWDSLSADQQNHLATQIDAIDFDQIGRLHRHGASHEDWSSLAQQATPPPAIRLADSCGGKPAKQRFTPAEAKARGAEALAEGEIGVLLVAGGQGTRLGFAHPKGMYSVGPVSGASLFQIHLEKVLATARRYGRSVPLYLMTSPATHDETVEYLARHDRFGLPEEDLTIFSQGTMPAVDANSGELLLADRGELFLSPDGHGGTVAGAPGMWGDGPDARRGVKHLFYFQVDNPLAPICDPEFLGYHLLARSELSTLVVAKQSPSDPLGNVVSIDGRVQIIEYIDLPEEAAERRNDDGSLVFWAGNTAIHVFDAEFLERMTRREECLPFHVSKKKVPHLNANGDPVEPDEPNALKFERFIFDLLPAAQRAIVVEDDPACSFAPVKNASGAATDTPELVQAAMVSLAREWLEAAGAQLQDDVNVEISPLWALDPEQVSEKIESDTTIKQPTFFCADE